MVEFLAVLTIEGGQTDQHLIDDGAERPPVGGLTVALSLQDLGTEVLSGAAEALRVLDTRDVLLAEAEIRQLDVAIDAHQDILWL